MKKRILAALLALALAVSMVFSVLPIAQAADERDEENYYYFTDRDGNEMKAPRDAFATRVVEFTPGDPWTKIENNQDSANALGLPDYEEVSSNRSAGDLNLGAGGVLVLEFDIAIYDGEGLDIYVFEVGGDVEDTKVEVSRDLVTWYDVGTATGRTAGVDLEGKVPDGARFRYVRLTDLKKHVYSSWPGADIDAVSGLNITAITSPWAEDELPPDPENPVFPDIFIGKDLTQPITREEFAAVSVKVFENLAGTKAIPVVVNPFEDTNEIEVLKAYQIGAVDGTSATTFEPNARLNREQCATMLTRVYKRITLPGWTLPTDRQFQLPYTMPPRFADDGYISDWAKDSVYFMAANKIIEGVGNNCFAPKNVTTEQEALGYANATREQALLIALRMVRNLK